LKTFTQSHALLATKVSISTTFNFHA
jgi:hypothetical protein